MNRSHRSLYNAALGAWVAAPETARSTRKGRGGQAGAASAVSTLSAAVALAAFLTTPAFALDANTLPAGGQVSAGAGSLATSGTTLTVNQASQKLSIDWNSFSIGSAATVNFVQPGASAIALNRVTGSDPSQIYGHLNANGQVFLLNPNGVLFAKGAQVNVGGLVASTLSLSNADFLAGNFRFSGTAGSVVNQGDISVADKGYVALLGGQVSNQGAIVARLGTVNLAAGSDITLDFAGDGLINLQVNRGAVNALAENRQLIRADGGAVLMTAKAADALVRAVVNNEGVVEARTVDTSTGTIKLLADMDNGITRLSGTLDASAPTTGNGGFVETSGQKVTVADSAKVSTRAANGQTGSWLIDPDGYTIAASGGDISGATLSSNLAGGSITIQSTHGNGGDGNVNVNDTVSWSANTLTLNATHNIVINSALNGSGTAGLALEYGQGAVAAGNTSTYYVNAAVNLASTGSFSTKLGSDGSTKTYTIITRLGAAGSTTAADLQGINGNLSGNYVLGSDIDASATRTWNSDGSGGYYGFNPLGNVSTRFTGTFDGLGHTLSRLTVNRPTTNYVGLFGYAASGSVIRNVGLLNASVTGYQNVGGLVGSNGSGTINNSYATGSVTGSDHVGGLVGYNASGTISNNYATGSVTGTGRLIGETGGLVGYNYRGTISNSYATGSVRGKRLVGGLVGYNASGTISNNYATGSVTSTSDSVGGLVGKNESGTISNNYATGSVTATWGDVGGLVGYNGSGTISNNYATGSVTGTYDFVGGLVGYNASGTISNNYATGSVTGKSYVGGLVGDDDSGTISNNYATGSVTGTGGYVGGLVGYNTSGTISNSYWDIVSTGQTGSAGGTGLSSSDMKLSTRYGWDTSVWKFYDGYTTPLLKSFLTPLTISASGASKTYDGSTNVSGILSYSLPSVNSSLLLGTLSADTSSRNVGSYTVTPSGLYSGQQGYDISYVGGTVNITPAPLTITALANSKTYDGAAYAGGNGVRYSGFVGGETNGVLGGTLAYTGSSQGAIDPGSYAITPRGLTSGNYAIVFVDGQLTILPVTPVTPTSPGAPYIAAVYAADTVGQASHPGTGNADAAAKTQTQPPAPTGSDLAFQTGGFSLHVIDGGMRLPAGLAREALPPLSANAASGNDGDLSRPLRPGGLP